MALLLSLGYMVQLKNFCLYPSCLVCCCVVVVGIQPLGRSGQRPELSQATGMSLVRCILGKFLGVVCHCFPPRLEVTLSVTGALTSATTREIPAAERGTCGREMSGNFA